MHLLYVVGVWEATGAHVHKYACISIAIPDLSHLACVNQAGYLNRIICWNKVWDARCYRAEKFHLSDHWLSWILKNGGEKKSTAEYPRLITLVEHSEACEK